MGRAPCRNPNTSDASRVDRVDDRPSRAECAWREFVYFGRLEAVALEICAGHRLAGKVQIKDNPRHPRCKDLRFGSSRGWGARDAAH